MDDLEHVFFELNFVYLIVILLSYKEQEEKYEFIDGDVEVGDQMRRCPLVDLLAEPALPIILRFLHFFPILLMNINNNNI